MGKKQMIWLRTHVSEHLDKVKLRQSMSSYINDLIESDMAVNKIDDSSNLNKVFLESGKEEGEGNDTEE